MSFRLRSLRSSLLLSLSLCIVDLCWSALALAAQPDPSLPGNHLVIKEVEVVIDEQHHKPHSISQEKHLIL